jgi:hypothetical protein
VTVPAKKGTVRKGTVVANPSKRRGTAAETAVVEYLRRRGWPHAERRALAGNKDRGDIAGIAGVVCEVKSTKTLDLSGWLREVETEKANADAHLGFVVAKKRGTTDPDGWYAVLTFGQLVTLLASAGYRSPWSVEQPASCPHGDHYEQGLPADLRVEESA